MERPASDASNPVPEKKGTGDAAVKAPFFERIGNVTRVMASRSAIS